MPSPHECREDGAEHVEVFKEIFFSMIPRPEWGSTVDMKALDAHDGYSKSFLPPTMTSYMFLSLLPDDVPDDLFAEVPDDLFD